LAPIRRRVGGPAAADARPGFGRLRPTEFLSQVPERARQILPAHLRGFEARNRWSIVQLWYGPSARVHYEVGFHRRVERVEVGLHFEADPRSNARLLDLFERDLIVAKAVSERFEAEPWDRGWARVYEMLPIEPLDDAYVQRVADRLAGLIAALQPELEAALADLGPLQERQPISGETRSRWHGRRRSRPSG
jgi:hypothetical protein